MSMRGRDSMTSIAFIASALLACGGAQLSATRTSEVQSAMRAAEEVGANDQPKAALHLQLARDEMTEAQRLAKDGDGDNASLMLYRARADAELALQLARTEQEQQKARQAWEKIKDEQQR
jgi:hypothetical protein